MFARTAIDELVDDGAHVGELRRGVCPHVRTLRPSLTGSGHLHRHLAGVQHILYYADGGAPAALRRRDSLRTLPSCTPVH